MGMDVIGVNPTNDRGSYFRNNVWWWRPLADFICNNYGEIASACENWHSNDGDGLDAEMSKSLAQSLTADLGNGKVAQGGGQQPEAHHRAAHRGGGFPEGEFQSGVGN